MAKILCQYIALPAGSRSEQTGERWVACRSSRRSPPLRTASTPAERPAAGASNRNSCSVQPQILAGPLSPDLRIRYRQHPPLPSRTPAAAQTARRDPWLGVDLSLIHKTLLRAMTRWNVARRSANLSMRDTRKKRGLGHPIDPPPPSRGRNKSHQSTSNNPAAPMPPPTHMVMTTYFSPRRLPSRRAWPTMRAPLMP